MATMLSMHALEGSTYIVRLDFLVKYSDGTPPSAVLPNPGLTWTLWNENKEVVNNRLNEPLTPAESVYIILTGDDLGLSGDYPEKRYVTVEGTFNSELGTNIRFLSETEIIVDNAVGYGPA